jgi:PKD repeat protein
MIPCNFALDNSGSYSEDLLQTDILGKPRNINTPDIGAVEIQNGVSLGEDITLCDTPVLLDAGPWASSYSWSTGDNTQVIEVNEPGTYYVDITGLCNTTGTDTIEVISSEIAASFDFEVFENNIIALYNTSTGNITGYTWEYETGTSTQENALIIFDSEGSYTVRLEASNSCNSDVAEKTIDIFYTGINSTFTNKEINVFPNPVEDQLNVIFESDNTQNIPLEIFDINGKLFKAFKMNMVAGENYFSADISELSTGTYILVFNNKNTYKIYKK